MALPGGPLEICFSFDTTVSMTKYIDEVKARLQSMVQKLQADIPGIRIALCAHGDYFYESYNNKSPYEMIKLDFTNDVVELCQFIQKAEPTSGGDWEEFYEYVLKEARETLSWSLHTNKVFVLIGDALPHCMADECNLKHINWRHEVQELVKKGVTVYGTYCKTPKSDKDDMDFFKELSKLGGGSFLKIKDFEDIFDTLMAICYREQGETALQALESYEREVKARQTGPSKDVNTVFTTLKKSASNASSSSAQLLQNLNKTRQRKPTNAKKTAAKGTATTRVKKGRITGKPVISTTVTKTNAKKTRTFGQVTKLATTVTKTSKPQNTSHLKANRKAQNKTERAKLRRERVPETNFLLREQSWSRWKPAFFWKCLGPNFIRRKSGIGFRAEKLFKTNNKIRTWLYEFSVSTKTGSRKVVVFRLSTAKEETNIDKLMKSTSVKSRLENVLKKGCHVFVRRLAVSRSSVQRQVDDTAKLYSYLWDADCTRAFVKDDVEM